MAVTIRMDASDFRRVREKVEGWEKRAKNLEPVLKGRAEALRTVVVRDAFGQSQTPQGQEWIPIKPATVERRRQGSAKPLIDTGTLRGSITASSTKNTIRVGVSGAANAYAAFHQFGTKHIPARPFIPTGLDSGPAAKWAARAKRRIIRYIVEGKV